MLGPEASVSVVLRHPDVEWSRVVTGLEACLEVAQDEHALEPGPHQPREVVDRRPLDTQKRSRDTAQQAGHPRRAYRPVEKVSSRRERAAGVVPPRAATTPA